ncbi:MAG: DUF2079 domain-containing protein [Lachnospiraceae bacterium]|nr:DUF2079 domain-containing protein [Lachnospiraceae bacterium]
MGNKRSNKKSNATAKKVIKPSYKLTMENVITRLIACWCLTVFIEHFKNFELAAQSSFSLSRFAIHYIICFLIVSVVHYYIEKPEFDAYYLLGSLVLFGFELNRSESSAYIVIATFFVFALAIYYYKDTYIKLFRDINKPAIRYVLLALIGVSITFAIAFLTVLRYEQSSSSTYDMGIFAQMFYNMKDNFSLNTTCERFEEMSHLHVHTSLIYYLILPIYFVFPHSSTLLVVQALAIGIGVIPLYLLAKKLEFSETMSIVICAIYALSPATFGGAFYDFHENVFLIPILLFLFYSYEANKLIPTIIFSVLTCMVKEDATLFIIVMGAYALLGRKDIKRGIIMMAIGGIAMILAFSYIAKYGDGLMTNHYANLVHPDSEGLVGILATLVTNPGYLITQMINTDKIEFILDVLMPVGFLAFATKHVERYILLIPFVFVNLLPEYAYQHDVFYQYVFGPYMFILYVVILNLADIKDSDKLKHIMLVCLITGVCAFMSQYGTKTYYYENYKLAKDTTATLKEVYDSIPDDSSVSASTFFLPKLAKRDVIYMIDGAVVNKGEIYDTEYAIFDYRPGFATETVDQEKMLYLSNGYEEIDFENEVYSLLKKVN